MPTLIENPAIPENLLMELADTGSREIVNMLLASARARALPSVVEALSGNEYVTPAEARDAARQQAEPEQHSAAAQGRGVERSEVNPEVEAAHRIFQQEHASEIAAEEGKPFELAKEDEPPRQAADAGRGTEDAASPRRSSAATPARQWFRLPAGDVSSKPPLAVVLQKRWTNLRPPSRRSSRCCRRLASLNVGQRIKLGFIGGQGRAGHR